jgi:hypothetical protein
MALNCFLATWSGAVYARPFLAALIEAEVSLREDRDSLLLALI